jgi:hypothetical protein
MSVACIGDAFSMPPLFFHKLPATLSCVVDSSTAKAGNTHCVDLGDRPRGGKKQSRASMQMAW